MDTVGVFVGLDYHDEAVQVCVLDRDGTPLSNTSVANDWHAIVRVVGRHGDCVHAAIESCVGAADLAEELVGRAGWSVDLAHPGFVARMKQNPDKTDFQDAQLLADLERVGYLPRVWLAPEPVRELRRLVRYRQQLAERRRDVKLRIRAVLREQRLKPPAGVNPWTRAWRGWLLQEAALSEQGRWVVERHLRDLDRTAEDLHEVEERLAAATAGDPEVARLMAQRGIGPVTAWTLRAEIGRFDRFRSGKQLARFCGLSPKNASSGQRQADAGLIRAANPQLRAVLIEAAHRLARLDPRWRALGLRLRAAGKPGSVAAAAVANRWVRWLFHEMMRPADRAA
jgi:transposase